MPSRERVQQVRAARAAQGLQPPGAAELTALLEPIWMNYLAQSTAKSEAQ